MSFMDLENFKHQFQELTWRKKNNHLTPTSWGTLIYKWNQPDFSNLLGNRTSVYKNLTTIQAETYQYHKD